MPWLTSREERFLHLSLFDENASWYMMSSWWLLWIVGMFLFVVPMLGYGWGYRGWGPPYPRYIQRRRAQQAALMNASGPFDHHAWGRGGDLVWTVFVVGVLVAIAAFWRG